MRSVQWNRKWQQTGTGLTKTVNKPQVSKVVEGAYDRGRLRIIISGLSCMGESDLQLNIGTKNYETGNGYAHDTRDRVF